MFRTFPVELGVGQSPQFVIDGGQNSGESGGIAATGLQQLLYVVTLLAVQSIPQMANKALPHRSR
jgi:hypothetical protein